MLDGNDVIDRLVDALNAETSYGGGSDTPTDDASACACPNCPAQAALVAISRIAAEVLLEAHERRVIEKVERTLKEREAAGAAGNVVPLRAALRLVDSEDGEWPARTRSPARPEPLTISWVKTG